MRASTRPSCVQKRGSEDVLFAKKDTAITAAGQTIPKAKLEDNSQYKLESEVYRGDLAGSAEQDGASDTFQLDQLRFDFNKIEFDTVAEPGSLALQIASVACLVLIARQRRGH